MTQRLAFATALGLVAFVVVMLGAVGVYVALRGPAVRTALAAAPAPVPAAPQQNTEDRDSEREQTAPSGDDNANSYPVSAEQAATIALAFVPGASLLQQPRLVTANGVVAYEVPLDRGMVYVDANQGRVIYSSAGGGRRRPRR